MLIRPAVVADSTGILEIYNHEVLTSVVTFDLVPRTEGEQREWISDRSGAHAVVVAVLPAPTDDVEADDAVGGERIIGFGALSPYRERPGYAATVEDSVDVHRDHRGGGVGAAILEALVGTARAHGFPALMAKVVDGHRASISLHETAGFEVVGKELQVGRKFGRFHDVVVLERLL